MFVVNVRPVSQDKQEVGEVYAQVLHKIEQDTHLLWVVLKYVVSTQEHKLLASRE